MTNIRMQIFYQIRSNELKHSAPILTLQLCKFHQIKSTKKLFATLAVMIIQMQRIKLQLSWKKNEIQTPDRRKRKEYIS